MNRQSKERKQNKEAKKGLKWRYRILIFVMMASIMGGTIFAVSRVTAAPSENQALKFGSYSASHKIDDGTLFIGIYLIDKDALTDELYDQALDSASEWGQQEIYYKSELGGGNWFNISDAGSLAEITSRGTPVKAADMADLYVRYHMGSDKRLIDVMTGGEKNPFDVIDPYDLRNLPELESIRLQYTYSMEDTDISELDFLKNRQSWDKGNLRGDVYTYRLLSVFFTLNLRDEYTDKADQQLANLYTYYKQLRSEEKDSEAEVVYTLMSKVDATRRTIVFQKLSQLEENALGELNDLIGGKYYTAKGSFKSGYGQGEVNGKPAWLVTFRNCLQHDFGYITDEQIEARDKENYYDWYIPMVSDKPEEDEDEEEDEEEEEKNALNFDQSLSDAIADSISSCEESYNEYSGNVLQDVDNVLGHAEYEYAMNIINAAASGKASSADVEKLKHIMNIKEGVIEDAEGEEEILKSELIGKADTAYSSAAKAGAGSEYLSAKNNKAGDVAMENALNNQKDALESKRSELQFMIEEWRKRTTDDEGLLNDIYARITVAEEWKGAVPGDAFATKSKNSISEYIVWLKETARAIKEGNSALSTELDKLKAEKDDLLKQKQSALDDNDLAKAAKLDAQIAAKDKDISDEENRLKDKLNNANNAGDAASALTDLGDSMAALADRLLDTAMERINNEDYDKLKNSLDALASIGAADQIDAIADALAGSNAPAELMDAIGDAKDKALANAGDNDLDGDKGSRSRQELLDAIAALFGDINSMPADKVAATITGLTRYSTNENDAAHELALEFVAAAQSSNNPYLYLKYTGDVSKRYVSAAAIGAVTDYRYAWENNKQEATMTRGGVAYVFTANNKVGKAGTESKTLKEVGKVFDNNFYFYDVDATDLFKCQAQYVTDSSYAVCVTDSVDQNANLLIEKINEAQE